MHTPKPNTDCVKFVGYQRQNLYGCVTGDEQRGGKHTDCERESMSLDPAYLYDLLLCGQSVCLCVCMCLTG